MNPMKATISATSVLPTLNPEWFSGVAFVAHCGFSSRSLWKFGDAHLRVIGLTRENQERLVLRLPAETCCASPKFCAH